MAKAGLVYLRPVSVVYCRVQGPYATSVNEAWSQMFGWLEKHGVRRSVFRGYGLARDIPGGAGHDTCTYDACVEIPDGLDPSAIDEIAMQKLPGGAYARQRHVGDFARIRDVIQEIRDNWAAGAGVQLDPRRPIVTIFLTDPATAEPDRLKADVCLPVATAVDGRSAA